MQYKYFSVFYIGGMILPKETSEIIIADDTNKGIKIILTRDIDSHSLIFDRHDSLANTFLNSQFGGAKFDLSSEKLYEDVNKIQEERKRKYGSSLFLLFEFTGDADCKLPEIKVEREAYFLLDLVDKKEIRNKFKSEINKVFTSLFIVSKQDFNPIKITDGVYFIAENSKPVFSFSFTFNITPTIASPLDESSLIKFSNYKNSSSNNFELESINQLLLNANLEHKDKLRSFLFIWTAMEIFVGVASKNYRLKFTRQDLITKNQENSELARNFHSISSLLTNHKHRQDFEEFKDIKKLRNGFIHNNKVQETDLPTDRLKTLLKKYLSLYLDNNP